MMSDPSDSHILGCPHCARELGKLTLNWQNQQPVCPHCAQPVDLPAIWQSLTLTDLALIRPSSSETDPGEKKTNQRDPLDPVEILRLARLLPDFANVPVPEAERIRCLKCNAVASSREEKCQWCGDSLKMQMP